MTIAITIKSNRSALKKSTARKIVSPVLPVGESARRLLHARKRAPKLEAGEGSDVCGLDITKEGKRQKEGGGQFLFFLILLCPHLFFLLPFAFYCAERNGLPPLVIELIFASARLTISAGSGAYCKALAYLSPSCMPHQRKSTRAFPLAASF